MTTNGDAPADLQVTVELLARLDRQERMIRVLRGRIIEIEGELMDQRVYATELEDLLSDKPGVETEVGSPG